MARYIDADLLIECLENLCDDYLYRANEKAKIAVTRCIEILQGTPTADVVSTKAFGQVKWERDTAIEQLESYGVGFCEDKEIAEVKHGEWKGESLTCSVCKRDISEIYDADSYMSYGIEDELKWCPFCGAKMDKEQE